MNQSGTAEDIRLWMEGIASFFHPVKEGPLMKFREFVKEQIAIIKDRDPAMKADREVFLYPSFWALW